MKRPSTERRPPVALTIAGSDSGGGAGVQADLKTFQAFHVFGASAITAVTAQNTRRVFRIQKVDPEVVRAQIAAVWEDLAPAACKTGMLADAEIIRTVAETLRSVAADRLVVDPVMVATSGDRLLEEDAVEALLEDLLPLATIVTPNVPEAEILAGLTIRDEEGMRSAAAAIAGSGAASVLLKGGHLGGEEVLDLFYDGETWREWRTARLDSRSTHGTGCTLSAGIAAGLALGNDPVEAIEVALAFTRRAIESAPGLGGGRGPLNHWQVVEELERPAGSRPTPRTGPRCS